MVKEWNGWTSLPLSERSQLPSEPGIYVVADSTEFVWYVGQAADLKARWNGRSHHRYAQLIRTNRKLGHRIYWKRVPVEQLNEQERHYIDQFLPELNHQKVKTYLPKEPHVYREIKRLLKALNKPTLLFPDVRAVVLGQYQGEEETRCVVVLIPGNDFMMLYKSTQKRFAKNVRNAWNLMETDCEKDEALYCPCQLPVYRFLDWQFEFIEVDELHDQLSSSESLREQMLWTIDLFGVSVRAVKDLHLMNQIDCADTSQFPHSDGRLKLQQSAHLNTIRPLLKHLEPGQRIQDTPREAQQIAEQVRNAGH